MSDVNENRRVRNEWQWKIDAEGNEERSAPWDRQLSYTIRCVVDAIEEIAGPFTVTITQYEPDDRPD